jgi:hypothetical protein
MSRYELTLPVCFCGAHDGMHVHVPTLVDGQYGLAVTPAEPIRPEVRPASPAPVIGGEESER